MTVSILEIVQKNYFDEQLARIRNISFVLACNMLY